MTVLITGLTQPIGQYLFELCLEQELEVRALIAPGEPFPRPRSDRFEPISGSLAEPGTIERAVRDVDIVYHTAGIVQGTAAVLREANAATTRRLLEACAGDVRRFVLVSNPAVYCEHPTPDTWPVRADARREPHGTPQLLGYGQSLVEAEDYVFEANRRYGMEYCVLRLATIWGRNNYALFVVNSLMRRPEMAEQMDRMFGPMQWLHGSDAARAVLLAGEAAGACNATFIVAGTEAVTTFDLLALLWDITRPNESNPFSGTAAAHRLSGPKLDIGKIEEALGFKPIVPVRRCLEELLDQVGRPDRHTSPSGPLPSSALPSSALPSSAAAPADMSGKTCVITGATSGIGLATAGHLAAVGARLVLVGRDRAKGEQALEHLRGLAPTVDATMLYADLSLMSEVRRLAQEILAAAPRIDVLINDAGAMFGEREVTVEGIERTFAVNHMSHFLLTALLRDRLVASAPARIITIASSGHRDVTLELDDLQGQNAFDPRIASKRGKLCNVLFTRELARQLAGTGVTANCLCPGFVATPIGDNLGGRFGEVLSRAKRALARPPAEAARVPAYLASARECAGATGLYYENGEPATPSPAALDDATARELWDRSARLAGLAETPQAAGASAAPVRSSTVAPSEKPMSGKTCVITGATSGIGLATAEMLAEAGARLLLVGRDPGKGEAALRRLRSTVPAVEASVCYADLSRLAEVKRVAQEILQSEPRIDVLINNAGAVFDQWQLTEDGLERTFALNHMGAFALMRLLGERLLASAPARVISVSSTAHRSAYLDLDELPEGRQFNSARTYAATKLCNVLFTCQLARLLVGTGVTANSLEPGLVTTGLANNVHGPFGAWLANAMASRGVPPRIGAQTVVHLAASTEAAGISGAYFEDCRMVEPARIAQDPAPAGALWEVSAAIAAAHGIPAAPFETGASLRPGAAKGRGPRAAA